MKHITIGDIHGRNVWKQMLLNVDINNIKVIFIGDYCDSFNVSNEEIYNNLIEIIEFKKQYPHNIVLILGNHDLHYIIPKINPTGGYRGEMYHQLNQLFLEHIDLFDMAYQYKDTLWSHAGITQTYHNEVIEFCRNHRHNRFIDYTDYASIYNSLLRINEYKMFWLLTKDSGGVRDYPSIEWSRPIDILSDKVDGINQIVGHTSHQDIVTYENYLTIVDNLAHDIKYLISEL